MLNYIVSSIVPVFIVLTLVVGIVEKKDVLNLFIEGVLDGIQVLYKIFPYIFAITIAINLLINSGVIEFLSRPFSSFFSKINLSNDVIPLFFLRPISGSASTGIVMEVLKNNGPDSIVGKIACILMGSTETTIYTMTVLFGSVNIKKVRGTLIAGLIADIIAIIMSIIVVNMGFF